MYKRLLLLFIVVIFCFKGNARAEGDYSFTYYSGISSKKSLGETLSGIGVTFQDAYFTAFALSKEFYQWKDKISLELEGQVVKHVYMQHNMEYNGVLILRWLLFPWDKYIDTSLAAGEGLSYASHTPEVEAESHDETSRFLNYLVFEFDFRLPQIKNWLFVIRTHHRSGVYGLFHGVHGASNFVCAGLKYKF